MAIAKAKPCGIEAGALYTTEEFCSRLGLGRKAFVAARRRGLPVRKLSRRIFIDADEAREWMRKQPTV